MERFYVPNLSAWRSDFINFSWLLQISVFLMPWFLCSSVWQKQWRRACFLGEDHIRSQEKKEMFVSSSLIMAYPSLNNFNVMVILLNNILWDRPESQSNRDFLQPWQLLHQVQHFLAYSTGAQKFALWSLKSHLIHICSHGSFADWLYFGDIYGILVALPFAKQYPVTVVLLFLPFFKSFEGTNPARKTDTQPAISLLAALTCLMMYLRENGSL